MGETPDRRIVAVLRQRAGRGVACRLFCVTEGFAGIGLRLIAFCVMRLWNPRYWDGGDRNKAPAFSRDYTFQLRVVSIWVGQGTLYCFLQNPTIRTVFQFPAFVHANQHPVTLPSTVSLLRDMNLMHRTEKHRRIPGSARHTLLKAAEPNIERISTLSRQPQRYSKSNSSSDRPFNNHFLIYHMKRAIMAPYITS